MLKSTEKCLSVVGSREPTGDASFVTREMIHGLKKGITVVSGMARGIDTIAHESAIHSHHRTCAVLGSGFNHCYPAINELLFEYLKKYELVISEYPPEVPPSPEKFPLRNRIIAGLSQK